MGFNKLCSVDHLTHDGCHLGLCRIGSLLHLLMADLYGIIEASQVGNHRDTEGLDAAMVCHNHLGYGTHAHGVATQGVIHAVLGRCLEGRTLHTHIHTMLHGDVELVGNHVGLGDEVVVIGLVHIREARTRGEVLTAQRVLREEVDMVGDDHQVADLELRVHAACRIRYIECRNAQLVHHAHREGDLLHGVALIEVEASLHGENLHAAQLAEDEFAAMPLNRRDGEVGDLRIRDLVLIGYF